MVAADRGDDFLKSFLYRNFLNTVQVKIIFFVIISVLNRLMIFSNGYRNSRSQMWGQGPIRQRAQR